MARTPDTYYYRVQIEPKRARGEAKTFSKLTPDRKAQLPFGARGAEVVIPAAGKSLTEADAIAINQKERELAEQLKAARETQRLAYKGEAFAVVQVTEAPGREKPKVKAVSAEAINTLLAKKAKREAQEASRQAEAEAKTELGGKQIDRHTISHAAKQAVKDAERVENEWHKELRHEGVGKRYWFTDGVKVAARWDDGLIYSLRINPRAHMVERIVREGISETSAHDMVAKMLKQSRKYELDPMDTYENPITRALESVDNIKAGRGKSLGSKLTSFVANEAFNRVPVLQQLHGLATLVNKMGSPDSGESKWGETKHNMLMAGPVETIAAVPVLGPWVVGFVLGTGAVTGGTASLLEGAALGVWTVGTAVYSQLYTPSKMEAAFDRVDKQVRNGRFHLLEALFDAKPTSRSVAKQQEREAKATVKAFEEPIVNHSRVTGQEGPEVAVTGNGLTHAVGQLDNFGKRLADPGHMAERGAAARRGLGRRGHGSAAGGAGTAEQQAPAPVVHELTLADRASRAQRAAGTHLEWVRYIQDWAPRMIEATSGKDKVYWRQSLAYANQQMSLYQKASSIVSHR